MSRKFDMSAIQNIVTALLEVDLKARESDKYLYYRVLQELGINTEIPLFTYLLDTEGVYPNYDSVSRARRKVQEDRQDLLGSRASIRYRKTHQTEIEEWVQNQ